MKGKLLENISLKIRKDFMVSRVKTLLISTILVVAFLTLNLWLNKVDLPKFDITENKVFTLSDASKNETKKVDQDVNITVYGYDENSNIIDLLKQYKKNNSKINYQIITDSDNPDLVKKYNLQSGDAVLILEVGEFSKTLTSQDFVSYDYTTYQQIDLTENAITNAILNLTIAEKPKVYVVTGHNELPVDQYLSRILAYMQNEVFDYSVINLLSTETIPNDCDLLAIISPQKDLMESELNLLKDYINKGGNIIYTSDLLDPEDADLPNWQQVLDLYGLTVENGIVYETQANSYVANSPFVMFPEIEYTSITSEISTDGAILLEMPKRIITANEEAQTTLNVTYEELLKSSEKSFFLTDFSENAINNVYNQEPGSSLIAVKATKKLNTENSENTTENSEEKASEIIVIANGTFISNVESVVAQGYGQVNLYNNADFFLNSVANLTDREDSITVRKETNSSTFTPTEKQNNIVLIIIFAVPIAIILFGILVWNYRKHKR